MRTLGSSMACTVSLLQGRAYHTNSDTCASTYVPGRGGEALYCSRCKESVLPREENGTSISVTVVDLPISQVKSSTEIWVYMGSQPMLN